MEKDVSKKHKFTFFQLRQKHVIIKFICQKLKEEMIIFLTLHNSSLCFRNNIRKNKRQSLKTILMLTCHLESKRKLPLTKTSDTRLIMLECYFTGDGWSTIKIIQGMYGMYDVYKLDITTEFNFLGSCGWDSIWIFWRCKELVKI